MRVVAPEEAADLALKGGELWPAYLAEAVIGYFFNARREKIRLMEAGA